MIIKQVVVQVNLLCNTNNQQFNSYSQLGNNIDSITFGAALVIGCLSPQKVNTTDKFDKLGFGCKYMGQF